MPKSSSQLYHINKNVFAFFMFYWFPSHHRAISSILPCHLEDLQIVLQGWKADRMGLKKTTKCVTRSGFRRLPHFNHSFSQLCLFKSVGRMTGDRVKQKTLPFSKNVCVRAQFLQTQGYFSELCVTVCTIAHECYTISKWSY